MFAEKPWYSWVLDKLIREYNEREDIPTALLFKTIYRATNSFSALSFSHLAIPGKISWVLEEIYHRLGLAPVPATFQFASADVERLEKFHLENRDAVVIGYIDSEGILNPSLCFSHSNKGLENEWNQYRDSPLSVGMQILMIIPSSVSLVYGVVMLTIFIRRVGSFSFALLIHTCASHAHRS